jgi:hypothetical protein
VGEDEDARDDVLRSEPGRAEHRGEPENEHAGAVNSGMGSNAGVDSPKAAD